jgi:hypothetical protein
LAEVMTRLRETDGLDSYLALHEDAEKLLRALNDMLVKDRERLPELHRRDVAYRQERTARGLDPRDPFERGLMGEELLDALLEDI